MKLLIATHNQGKFAEYSLIFRDLLPELTLVSLLDIGIKEKAPEDWRTFEENAIEKAKLYYRLSKLPTLADDGGLEIDYLNGEPGVKSRRWPGYEATDEELISLTLKKLRGISKEKRGAQLRVVIALLLQNDKVYTFESALRGLISEKPTAIVPGYPFRSILYLPEISKTLGELSMAEEAAIAHRKKAVEKALLIIRKYIC